MGPKPKRDAFASDSAGELAWLAACNAWSRERGRSALEGASEYAFEPDKDGGGGKKPPAGTGEEGDPEEPTYEMLKIPRIVGKIVRIVPLSLPDGGPVTPLGVQNGVFWFLTPHGELIGFKSSELGQASIDGLYAPDYDWLYRAFPQFNQQRQWKGFAAQYARAALMGAAASKGVFDARDKVRGTGCWKSGDGQLIQHLGDRIVIGGKAEKPGEIGNHVYPGRPPIAAPKPGGKGDCEAIYTRMRSWKWARGELDARLLLGWMACSVLGAALDWRPMVFITGDAGTGKSTLQDMLKAMLPGRLLSTVDASPAALRQMVNQDAIGVTFDEIEADMLTDQAQMVMKIARVAASGGTTYRGGQDHKASEFTLRGCFSFSAIVPPAMRQQDMQRFAFLRLYQLDKGARLPSLTEDQARDLGSGLAGRITEGWSRWKTTLAAYVTALEGHGHAHRGATQFGTLLAAADVLLHDQEPDSDSLEQWCSQLRRDGLFEYELSEPTWLTTWRRILSAQPEVWRAHSFPTVAEVLQKYVRAWKGQQTEEMANKQSWLNRAGLAVVHDRNKRPWLAIPPRGQAITQIFAATDMRAHGGDGGWTMALRGAPKFENGDGVWKSDNVRALQGVKCTFYRLDAVVELAGVRTPIFDEGPAVDEDDQVLDASYEPSAA